MRMRARALHALGLLCTLVVCVARVSVAQEVIDTNATLTLVGDVDNDGHTDLLTLHGRQGLARIFFNYTGERQEEIVNVDLVEGGGGDTVVVCELADANDDGFLDIVYVIGAWFESAIPPGVTFPSARVLHYPFTGTPLLVCDMANITGVTASTSSAETWVVSNPFVHSLDLDGDGLLEIFVSPGMSQLIGLASQPLKQDSMLSIFKLTDLQTAYREVYANVTVDTWQGINSGVNVGQGGSGLVVQLAYLNSLSTSVSYKLEAFNCVEWSSGQRRDNNYASESGSVSVSESVSRAFSQMGLRDLSSCSPVYNYLASVVNSVVPPFSPDVYPQFSYDIGMLNKNSQEDYLFCYGNGTHSYMYVIYDTLINEPELVNAWVGDKMYIQRCTIADLTGSGVRDNVLFVRLKADASTTLFAFRSINEVPDTQEGVAIAYGDMGSFSQFGVLWNQESKKTYTPRRGHDAITVAAPYIVVVNYAGEVVEYTLPRELFNSTRESESSSMSTSMLTGMSTVLSNVGVISGGSETTARLLTSDVASEPALVCKHTECDACIVGGCHWCVESGLCVFPNGGGDGRCTTPVESCDGWLWTQNQTAAVVGTSSVLLLILTVPGMFCCYRCMRKRKRNAYTFDSEVKEFSTIVYHDIEDLLPNNYNSHHEDDDASANEIYDSFVSDNDSEINYWGHVVLSQGDLKGPLESPKKKRKNKLKKTMSERLLGTSADSGAAVAGSPEKMLGFVSE